LIRGCGSKQTLADFFLSSQSWLMCSPRGARFSTQAARAGSDGLQEGFAVCPAMDSARDSGLNGHGVGKQKGD
jgi:hypothetical protein